MSPVRKTLLTLTVGIPATLAVTAGVAFAGVRWTAPEGMRLDGCLLTAQPWNETQYALDIVHADGTVDTLLEQTYGHLAPTSWTVGADVVEVRWAKHVDSDEFHDHLTVEDCAFTTPYAAMPGKQDSVTIAPIWAPTPTSSTTSTTTTEVPPAPTTTAPFTEQTTVPQPPAETVDVPTPLPSTSVPETLADTPTTGATVELATPVTLPVTGGPQGFLGWLGLSVIGVGSAFIGLCVGLSKRDAR